MIGIDRDLASRLGIRRLPNPDFSRLRQALLREGVPEPLPLFELKIDDEVLSAILGEPVGNPGYVGRAALGLGDVKRAETERYVAQLIRAYLHLGYDHVVLSSYLPMTGYVLVGEDTASLPHQKGRAWVDEKRGPVTTWREFEEYGWCEVRDVDFYNLESAAQSLPEGMGLLVSTRGVMDWLMRLMGFETLCYALADDPDLVEAVACRVGKLVVGLVGELAEIEGMGAIVIYDDMGFKTGPLISPDALRRYVFPWLKECVDLAHRRGLPFVLHACGNLELVMDDLIDDVRIDAKHSFEDTIMPMAQVKAKYGDRIGILGGVDMHILASGTAGEVRAATRQAILDCAPGGGFAFGSGNTIANFVPVANYLAMLDEAQAQ